MSSRLPARFTIAHGLMVAAGLMTFVFVSAALRERDATTVVAYAGAQSRPGTFEYVATEVPSDLPGIEYFAIPEDFEHSLIGRSVTPGEPILRADLVAEERLDYRTIALPVDGYQIDGLDLRSGDRVDVVGFGADDSPGYIAVNLVVESTSSASNDGFGKVGDSFVTVRVEVEDAVQLSAAQRHGPLHIVRSTGTTPTSVTMQVALGEAR